MNRRMLFLIILFISCSCCVKAQTPKIEALKQRFYNAVSPPDRLNAVLDLCEEQESINRDSLVLYANFAVRLANTAQDPVKKSLAQIAVIHSLLRRGKTDSALRIVEAELKKNSFTDPAKRSVYFKLSALKADCYGDASDYEGALAELYKLVSEAEEANDSAVLAKNMNTIGVINYNLDHVPEAFSWYRRGIAYTGTGEKEELLNGRAALFINMGDAYRWIDKRDSAVYFIDSAVILCRKIQNLFFLSNSLRVKASIYKKLKNFKAAEELMTECIAIREKTEGKLSYSNEYLSLAMIYFGAGQTDRAIDILKNSMSDSAREATDYALRISYLENLARCYKIKNDEKNYSAALLELINAKDAFYEINSAKAIAELQTKYEVQKKESTIIKQKLDLTRQNYLLYGSFVLLAFIIIIGWLLFKNYRRRQQQQAAKALYEEKIHSATAVQEAEENERKRVAADLHDNLGAYAASIASNLDHISLKISEPGMEVPMKELRNNSQAIVSSLADTIWALKKNALSLTVISDRVKSFIQRLNPSYPQISIEVKEEIAKDHLLPAAQAFHLFRIVQESINNAIRHSNCNNIIIQIRSDEQTWQIFVTDDGKGISAEAAEKSENGIMNIKNRAAQFGWSVIWIPNKPGTIVSVQPTTN